MGTHCFAPSEGRSDRCGFHTIHIFLVLYIQLYGNNCWAIFVPYVSEYLVCVSMYTLNEFCFIKYHLQLVFSSVRNNGWRSNESQCSTLVL